MGGPWVPDFAGDMKEIKDWLLLTIYGLTERLCIWHGRYQSSLVNYY